MVFLIKGNYYYQQNFKEKSLQLKKFILFQIQSLIIKLANFYLSPLQFLNYQVYKLLFLLDYYTIQNHLQLKYFT